MTTTRDYLETAIATFERCPADNDYQQGFLDALKLVLKEGLSEATLERSATA